MADAGSSIIAGMSNSATWLSEAGGIWALAQEGAMVQGAHSPQSASQEWQSSPPAQKPSPQAREPPVPPPPTPVVPPPAPVPPPHSQGP